MRIVRKIPLTAFLLITWLMAVNHCELRASGILSDHAHSEESGDCCADASAGCFENVCGAAEADAYRPDSKSLKVTAPAVAACLCQLCSLVERCFVEASDNGKAWAQFTDSSGWVPNWQFERRAAAPAHAPDPSIV